MKIVRYVSVSVVTLGLFSGCGGGGDLPVAPSAEEAKKALDAAGPDAAAKAQPGIIKQEGKFGSTETKVNAPTPASPM